MAPVARDIRDTLFGDGPLELWPPSDAPAASHEPWVSFVRAREALCAGDRDRAIALWRSIADMPDLESRHVAQAWHFLRAAGAQPSPSIAKRLLAVVFEVPTEGGLDLLSAYPERTARYFNFSGAAVIWERPSAALDEPIEALLAQAQKVLNAIGPSNEPRRPPPPPGQARVSMVSPAGLHFGQGSLRVLMSEAFSKPLFMAGIVLMQAMVKMDLRTRR